MSDLREKLAELAHDQWSGWMRWMFDIFPRNEATGRLEVPQWAEDRWKRQMNTPYAELSDEEKHSDRVEADKYLPIIERAVKESTP